MEANQAQPLHICKLCERLRSLVQDCINKHLYTSAIFYADKLITFSAANPSDIYLLAQAYHLNKQNKRALNLLRQYKLHEKGDEFRYLAACCLYECGEWEECLVSLGDAAMDELTPAEKRGHQPSSEPRVGSQLSLPAAMHTLRGHCHEMLDNRTAAVSCYTAALRADPYCYDAFEALIGGHMLDVAQEVELLEHLEVGEDDKWLALLYACKCKKYFQADTIDRQLAILESPYAQTPEPSLTFPTPSAPTLASTPTTMGPSPTLSAAHNPYQRAAGGLAHSPTPTPSTMGPTPMAVGPTPTSMGATPTTIGPYPSTMGPTSTTMGPTATPATHFREPGPQDPQFDPTPGITHQGAYGGSGQAFETPSMSWARGPLPQTTMDHGNVGRGTSEEIAWDGSSVQAMEEEGGSAAAGMSHRSTGGGWGLAGNIDVVTCRAEWYYHCGLYEAVLGLTMPVLRLDPHALQVLPLHLAAATALGRKNELFLCGHRLVAESPDAAISWYAVGCYYMATSQIDLARRYFAKATSISKGFAPAWIGYAHAFAAQDEHDQALAAYRTASRLFPGLHTPLLGMGVAYLALGNPALGERALLAAHRACDADPAVSHELGVMCYRGGELEGAELWLRKALELIPGRGLTPACEPTLVALGHVMRKRGELASARALYTHALSLAPGQPGTEAALGFTHHLAGELGAAVQRYHRALALKPDDSFVASMLAAVLQEYADEDG